MFCPTKVCKPRLARAQGFVTVLPHPLMQGLVSSRHRLTMCQLAVQSSDWIRWVAERAPAMAPAASAPSLHHGGKVLHAKWRCHQLVELQDELSLFQTKLD